MSTLLNNSQKSYAQNQKDLSQQLNRLKILKREHEGLIRKNMTTLFKTDKILNIKNEKVKVTNSLTIKKMIRTVDRSSSVVKNERQDSKKDSTDRNSIQQKLEMLQNIKQEKCQNLKIIQKRKDDDQSLRKMKHDSIMKQQSESKLKINNYWNQKRKDILQQNQQYKQLQKQEFFLQNQSKSQFEKIEMELLEQLQNTSVVTQALNKQLYDAFILSRDKFYQIYPNNTQQNCVQLYQHLNSYLQTVPKQVHLPYIDQPQNSQRMNKSSLQKSTLIQEKSIRSIYSQQIKVISPYTISKKNSGQNLQDYLHKQNYQQSQSSKLFADVENFQLKYKNGLNEHQQNRYTDNDEEDHQQFKKFKFPIKIDKTEPDIQYNEISLSEKRDPKNEEEQYIKEESENKEQNSGPIQELQVEEIQIYNKKNDNEAQNSLTNHENSEEQFNDDEKIDIDEKEFLGEYIEQNQ